MHFTTAVAAALQVISGTMGTGSADRQISYKTPMLIARAIPYFSAGFICKVQTIFQGNRASVASIAAERPGKQTVSNLTHLCLLNDMTLKRDILTSCEDGIHRHSVGV